jgi:predicted dinucleotide-binding enzyme
MKVSIIGAGNVGTALAGSLARAGHTVTITASTPEHAATAAASTGATAVATNAAAIDAADVVILAVPSTAFAGIAEDSGSSLDGKVVVDVANRPTPDPAGATDAIAEELQVMLPKAKVIKAFNTAFASRQASPTVGGVAADGYVAGDDAAAKATILDLVSSIGFRPVDAGSLASARTLEGMAWLNISRNFAGGTWQDAWVLLGPDSAGN